MNQVNLKIGPVALRFALAVINGTAKEIGVFSSRGEAKTITALAAMGGHAAKHSVSGHALPVKWLGVTETFAAHKAKTHESLQKDFWQGAWRLEDGGHKAILSDGESDGVLLDLFGVEDSGAIDRMRTESCCMWVDEPAPATTGPGVSEAAWETGLSSLRLASHSNVALFTSNLPEEVHWTWKRFAPTRGVAGVHPEHKDRVWFRIPRGDNPHVTPQMRAEWEKNITRPDLRRRLILGEPGVIMLGKPVAQGFSLDEHVSQSPLRIVPREPIAVGFDFGLTPTAVIGQEIAGCVRVYFAVGLERGGIRQLIEGFVSPWLAKHAAGHELLVGYDPAGDVPEQTDIEQSPAMLIQEKLGCDMEAGPVSWESRKNALLTPLNRRNGLLIDPSCKDLIATLSTRWYYKENRMGGIISEKPSKDHPWSDYGDALCYLLCRLGQSRRDDGWNKPIPVEKNISWL